MKKILLVFLLSGGLLWADTPKEVQLTEGEKTQLELNQEKIKNISLQIQLLQQQIMKQQNDLNTETQTLREKFAKAHNVDLNKFFLDTNLGKFVELPHSEPAKKSTP